MADTQQIAKKPARFGVARFGASRFGFTPRDRDTKEAGGVGESNYYVHRDATPILADEAEHTEVES